MMELNCREFTVTVQSDWNAVANYLLNRATQNPLNYREKDTYSPDERTAFKKIAAQLEAGKAKEMTRYSAVVNYQPMTATHATVLSLVLTREPGVLHLSMLRLVPGVTTMAVSDPLAHEAAREILGTFEERREGVMKGVRHFYQTVS